MPITEQCQEAGKATRFQKKHENYVGFENGNAQYLAKCGHPASNPKAKFCRDCYREFVKSPENSPSWKGGKYLRPDGYVHVYVGMNRNGTCRYELEHRLVAAHALGRALLKTECVHHINMNRADNRNCNLLICTQAYNTWLVKAYAEAYVRENENSEHV